MDDTKKLLIDVCKAIYEQKDAWSLLPYEIRNQLIVVLTAVENEKIPDYYCQRCEMPPHQCLCSHDD
jgi:hypothetical protein